tara:strand:- start:4879 stop:5034 length:156 start_codon:yes stop_codon:yes gene_type:complete
MLADASSLQAYSAPTIAEAQSVAGPTLINVEVDYSENGNLFADAHNEDVGN